MPRRLTQIGFVLAALAALACVTINVYFPEAEVKELSERIEEAVEEGYEDPPADDEAEETTEGEQISLLGAVVALVGPSPAWADQAVSNHGVESPAMRRIIESRRGRVRELNRFKAQGAIGESNKGLLVARGLKDLSLQDRAAVQKLVREENADRQQMFREMASATGTDLSQLPQIQETVAETLRERARPGEWIQLPNGQWQQKR